MSSFKKLSKADITTVPYAANKQWVLPYTCPSISNDYFNVYKGTYITGTFYPNNFIIDPVTNGQYERLIYDSMNHLFYQAYNGILLNTSSLMFDVDTYQSSSQQRPTSSYFDYNINPLLIKNFPTGAGAGIEVLAINQDIYGSKVLPHSFCLSSSEYYITDDGYGNLSDVVVCNSYTLGGASGSIYAYKDCTTGNIVSQSISNNFVTVCGITSYGIVVVDSGDPSYTNDGVCSINSTHIGNIFYAHGIAVITNPNYQGLFPLPPIAVNDVATFLTSQTSPKIVRLLDNDVSRSCALDTSSIALYGNNSSSYTIVGNGTIQLNATTAGNYDVYYTVDSICGNGCGLTSNMALANVNIVQVNPPPCITVELYGSKGDTNTFWYVLCGDNVTSSITLHDYDPPVQRCIDSTFGVSGSSQYTVIGACTSGSIVTGSYSVNIYGMIGSSLIMENNTEIYYSIGTGSSTYFNLIDTNDTTCNYKGSISVPSGSSLSIWLGKTYPVGYYNSYNAVTSSTCPTNLASYCGSTTPFTVTVGSSMNISLTAYVSGGLIQTCAF